MYSTWFKRGFSFYYYIACYWTRTRRESVCQKTGSLPLSKWWGSGHLKDGNNNPVCKTAKETQMYRTVFWTLWERARVGWFGRMALKHVYYHMWNESPVQVQCMILDAWGWCTEMTQRDSMGREEGEGFRMGNTCIPVADSCWCMQNQYSIVK